jgi:hypothetical protein
MYWKDRSFKDLPHQSMPACWKSKFKTSKKRKTKALGLKSSNLAPDLKPATFENRYPYAHHARKNAELDKEVWLW